VANDLGDAGVETFWRCFEEDYEAVKGIWGKCGRNTSQKRGVWRELKADMAAASSLPWKRGGPGWEKNHRKRT
jgi:hypothetical protein